MILINIKSHINQSDYKLKTVSKAVSKLLMACAVVIGLSLNAAAQRRPVKHHLLPDTLKTETSVDTIHSLVPAEEITVDIDSVFETFKAADTVKVQRYDVWEERNYEFNPDPTRAVWMSALFPGLGQIYNRRYWKLPIIIGGYLGLAYATSWNNGMLNDYTKAYRDIMDSDPTTKSYMDFFPSTVKESDLDNTWLTNILQSRKNYYRRNRDLCIICMVGVYLVAMVDAYVDASLSHFDVSPDLSMDVAPAIFQETRGMRPAIGLQWALTF
jgi:hypothetical protein